MGQGRFGEGGLNPAQPAAARATIRCFVALQPDEAARVHLDDLARTEHGRHPQARRMRRDNLHLTLAFIGTLDAAAAREVAARLAAETIEPFDWRLDEVGAFDGARVLWAGGTHERLEGLAARSRALLDTLGVRFDRKRFVAHVTLLRNLPRAAARTAAHRIEPPIAWRVTLPALLQSTTGAHGTRYTPVCAGNG